MCPGWVARVDAGPMPAHCLCCSQGGCRPASSRLFVSTSANCPSGSWHHCHLHYSINAPEDFAVSQITFSQVFFLATPISFSRYSCKVCSFFPELFHPAKLLMGLHPHLRLWVCSLLQLSSFLVNSGKISPTLPLLHMLIPLTQFVFSQVVPNLASVQRSCPPDIVIIILLLCVMFFLDAHLQNLFVWQKKEEIFQVVMKSTVQFLHMWCTLQVLFSTYTDTTWCILLFIYTGCQTHTKIYSDLEILFEKIFSIAEKWWPLRCCGFHIFLRRKGT